MRRLTLAAYIAEQISRVPIEALMSNAGIKNFSSTETQDTITELEVSEDGRVLRVFKSSVVSTAPPIEPPGEPVVVNALDQAAERIFPVDPAADEDDEDDEDEGAFEEG